MRKEEAIVVKQSEVAPGIYDMWIATDLAKQAGPGQFIHIYPKGAATLLPRPISICEVDREKNQIRMVYRIAGKGTKEFSAYLQGETIAILGILGNGFPMKEGNGKEIILMGGGIGIPPLLQTAKELTGNIKIIAGYRDDNLFLLEDLKQYGEVLVATEDGSVGVKGNVMDVIKEYKLLPEIIFACGPMPMLRAIKQYAAGQQIKAYLSLEEKMACGVGACLGCVCKTTKVDGHSHVKNARVCTEGPVFEAQEVEIS